MKTPTCVNPDFRNQWRDVQIIIMNRYKGLRHLNIIDDQEYNLVLATLKGCRRCIDEYEGYSINEQGMVVEYKQKHEAESDNDGN